MDSLEHCTITARLRRFSSCDGDDAVSTEYYSDSKRRNLLKDYFGVTFYANGSCVGNEGHISIVFNILDGYFYVSTKPVTFSCVASVIDASGNKRFTRSLALDLDYNSNENDKSLLKEGFGFDKFLKRSTLLSDSQELLPGDCLTLCLEIDYEVIRHLIFDTCWRETRGFHEENGRWYLCMNTEFGRELCKMSTVFRDMMECTIVESGPDRIPIALKEYRTFLFIYGILHEFKLHVTLSDICKLYLFADKYDMQPIVQLCHRLLISVMREMNTREKLEYVERDIHMISELAERFADDERLREILAIYSDIKRKLEGCSGELDACKLATEWNCEYLRQGYLFYFFLFSKNKSERLVIDIYK